MEARHIIWKIVVRLVPIRQDDESQPHVYIVNCITIYPLYIQIDRVVSVLSISE